MLFVSRYVWRDREFTDRGDATDKILFGVVDTEDDVEEVVAWRDIEKASSVCGLDIAGVDVVLPSRSVRVITPWQDPTTASVMQVKSSVLWHTEVTVWGSHVTAVTWHSDRIVSPVTLRLSDFGDYCEDCILYDNFGSGSVSPTGEIGAHKITFVLDDKVRVTPDTFRVGGTSMSVLGKGGLGVVLDLREVTDDSVADVVYGSLYRYYGNPLDSVIDTPERYNRVQEDWSKRRRNGIGF